MVADKIRKEGLNVRQVEQLITRLNENNQKPKKRPEKKDIFIASKETELRDSVRLLPFNKVKEKAKSKLSISVKKILREYLI